jgi:hypothetical protein
VSYNSATNKAIFINSIYERGNNVKKSILIATICLSISVIFLAGMIVPSEAATQRKAIIVYHNDWGDTPNALKTELQGRGYSVTMTDSASQGLTALTNAFNSLVAGDFLVVYLAGHGHDPRTNRNDTSKATALSHYVQFNNGILYVSQTAPLFEKIANKGVHLIVIDGSCNGGEAVLYAMGQKYCAVSTTGVYSPSLTGFPSPATSMSKDSKPGEFGLWWDSHLTASWMNGDIVFRVPERINQRLFRNDKGAIANLSLFLRPSIAILTVLDLGGWNLHYQYCYLYRLIYPDEYAALSPQERAKFTNSLQTYLTTMHTYLDPTTQFFTELSKNLNNSMLLNSSALIYAANYEKVWQTLANDTTWNVNADPGKHAAKMKGLNPDQYKGKAGFFKIADEIEFLMTLLKNGYALQEDVLKQIDAAAKDLYGSVKIASMIKKTAVKKAWPPEIGEPVKKYNQFERNMMKRINDIENRLQIKREYIHGPLQQSHSMVQVRPDLRLQKTDAQNVIEHGIDLYKGEFMTPVKETFGLSHAALSAMKKQKLEELIRKFKTITPTLYYAEGRISFLLAIVEDSVSKIQSAGNSPCDTVPF